MSPAKKDNFYPHAEAIIEKMVRKSGLSQNKFAQEILGIKGANITRARQSGKIPETWFVTCQKKLGLSKEELCALPGALSPHKDLEGAFWGRSWEFSGEAAGAEKHERHQKKALSRSAEAVPEDPSMLRHYRKLARMDTDLLHEVQTWLNAMEERQPGHKGWFRLEFHKRFPEFASWRSTVIKGGPVFE